MDTAERLASALGRPGRSLRRLRGGCVADVLLADLGAGLGDEPGAGTLVVVKRGGLAYETEAMMLRWLRERSSLPVPAVLHSEPDLLVIEHVEHDGRLGESGERHAAELLAALHAVPADTFGFERDTLIGPLDQPCPPTASWVEFFAAQRLRHFGALAHGRGAITGPCWDALRRLADRLGRHIEEPEHPSLIHGDVWSGNVLADRGRIAAFIDPAVHYAHPEAELAFITLFSTFGRPFFARYHELRPIREGFFERRRSIYNLYPLLVHAILFGGGYAEQVERMLKALDP
ncbi:MAG TPA: fructosamine kinase family protein [Phycisphaerales bacterium]|nr:fructosamine kinase family protein [Phycisphaerales bacterium]